MIFSVHGTLGIAGKGIPRGNIEAIKNFISQGGNFGIATGRWVSESPELLHDVPLNLPCIVSNGGSIYDFQHRMFLKHEALPKAATRYLKEILADYRKWIS